MISADSAISRFRRDLTLSAVLRGLLIGGAIASVLLFPNVDPGILITAFIAIWLVLSFQSAAGSRLIAESPALISLGRFDEAEASLDRALRSFSIFRGVKLLSLHHLAVLRYKQQRWDESAKLCRALLSQRLGGLATLGKPSQLILADDLLQLGDLRGTHEAITRLYSYRLTLPEATQLMLLQLDYEMRIGAWSSAAGGLRQKVDLAELLPGRESARAHAMMALAAQRTGQEDWAVWLRSRAALLANPNELMLHQPILKELFGVNGAAPPASS
jgi:hypothetical protein